MKRASFALSAVILLLATVLFMAGQTSAAHPMTTAVSPINSDGQAVSQTIFTASATKDSWVDENNPSTNYGSDLEIWINRNADNTEGHGLIHFDVSGLPDNINVISATLSVYSIFNRPQSTAPAAGLFVVQPEAIISSWNENSVTWNNKPPSTYLNDPGVGYQLGWLDYDVTNIAQAWVAGTVVNHGIKLVPQPNQTGFSMFF